MNGGGFPPFAWFEADALLGASTVLTPGGSSWGAAPFASGANTLNTTDAFRANIFTNQTEWAISPSIFVDPAITNLQVEFDASVVEWNTTNQGYMDADDSLAVVVSTDNGATWSNTNVLWAATDNDTIDLNGEHIVIPLTGYSGYLRFGIYGKSIGGPADNDFYIDNFEVRTPRACNSPILDSITGITSNSATLNWTNGDAGSSSWDIILATGGQPANAGAVTTVTSSGSYNFMNLTDATAYCVYIVETCPTGISDTVGPLCFNTQCLAFTAPYFEDFEGATASCWSQDQIVGTNSWTIATGSTGGSINTAFAGNLNAQFTSSSGGPHVTRFISPVIDVTPLSTVELSFWYAQEVWAGDQNYTNVYYRISSNDPWVFAWGDSTNVATWTKDSLIIPVSSATLQIAFEGVDLFGRGNILDNISIHDPNAAPACAAPTGLDTVSVDCDEVDVTWVSGSSTTSTILEWGTSGFALGAGTTVTGVTAAHTISSLTPNTAYDFYVRDVCATGDTSAWAGPYTFTTDTTPTITSAFTFTQSATTASNATVDFDGSSSMGATNYVWDFGNGQIANGMNATTVYDTNGTYTVCLAIEGDCGAVDTLCQTVVIQGINLDENEFNATLNLFPNPSKGSFVLNVGNTSKSFDIEITDLRGRVVYRADNLRPREDHVINIDAEAAGVYMLNIKGNGLLMNRRIMIER